MAPDPYAPRLCQREGCETSIAGAHGNARYCSDACKSRQWRAKTGYTVLAARIVCQTRKPRAPRTRKRPSGLQIAFRKAVAADAALIQALAREPATLARYADRPDLCTRLAEATLREVLSEKQRARLGAPVEPDPVVVFYNDLSRVKRTRPARRAA